MKILHAITTLDVGGAEMHLLAQVRGQSLRGHEVHVAYLKGQGTLRADFLQAGARSVTALGGPLRALLTLRNMLADVDLLHTHLLKADMLGAAAALLAGRRRKLVASKHNDEQVLRKPLVSFVHGLLGNVPVRTIVLSDHVGRFVHEHGRVKQARLVRVYYGLDPTPFAEAARANAGVGTALRSSFGFGAHDVVFVCVARFAAQKAHDVLLRAFASAAASDARLRLLLVGDDPFGDGRQRAEAVHAELGLGGKCVFAGIRRDVPALMAMSDVFVMCSLWEGLGLVFLEAMACNLPVLATRVSAVPEVVIEERTGLLVPPSDVAALAAAMLRLAGDPALRERLGALGRERVLANFGLERMVAETLDVYRQVLGA